jgi:hypothetical protein
MSILSQQNCHPTCPLAMGPEWSMGLRPTQVDENDFCSATTLHGSVALPFVIPSAAEGIRSSANLSWKCFSTERARISIAAAPLLFHHAVLEARREPAPCPLDHRQRQRLRDQQRGDALPGLRNSFNPDREQFVRGALLFA